jgi:polyisoprenoid-binding protein YceI
MFQKTIALFMGLGLVSQSLAAVPAKVDTEKSKITWIGSKIGSSHNGSMALKEGTLEFDGDKLVGGTMAIDMTSIKVLDSADKPESQAKLAGHLKSDDFFAVDKHPEAKLVIKSVTPLAKREGRFNHTVVGDLTIKGKTHPVTIQADLMTHGVMFHGSGKAIVDRTLYDVRYGSGKFFENLGDKVIHDNFEVGFEVFAKLPEKADKKKVKAKG